MCVFGRPTKDLIPILPGKYHPHQMWSDSLDLREATLRQRHMSHHDKWSEHTRALTQLRVGDKVRIQNQTGPHPTKWDRTGTIVEVRQFHQYLVRMDGSGRLSPRNRKFLRKYVPVYEPPSRRTIQDDMVLIAPPPPTETHVTIPHPTWATDPPRTLTVIVPIVTYFVL